MTFRNSVYTHALSISTHINSYILSYILSCITSGRLNCLNCSTIEYSQLGEKVLGYLSQTNYKIKIGKVRFCFRNWLKLMCISQMERGEGRCETFNETELVFKQILNSIYRSAFRCTELTWTFLAWSFLINHSFYPNYCAAKWRGRGETFNETEVVLIKY